jgi:signal transduction histidine kinase/ligand-binding sensor domain-containing protein/AraC-like DNA-binding protein
MTKQPKYRKPFFLLLYFTLILGVQTSGNSPFIFKHLTTREGLSNSNINSIIKDSYGFLWVATQYGLNRYDGYEFKIYTTNPGVPNSMIANNLLDLQEDGMGNIWIGSYSYMIYNRDKDNFITDVPDFLKRFGIHTTHNFKVYIDKNKDIWVLNETQAFFFNIEKQVLKTFDLEMEPEDLGTLELSDDGERLYGIFKASLLWSINIRTGLQEWIEMPENIDHDVYNRVFVDYKGGLWIWSGKTDTIYYKRSQGQEWELIKLNPTEGAGTVRLLDFIDDKNGHVWIGTDHNGLFIYNFYTGAIINVLEDRNIHTSIASNNIGYLYRDDDGIIWVGHNKKGISYYHHSFHNIVNYEHPECRDVSAILEDRKGRIWLGTDGNGLFRKQKEMDDDIDQLPILNSPVISLLEDQQGRVWIGTYSDGLYYFDDGRFNQITDKNSNLATNNVWGLEEDRYGNIWIATLGGGMQMMRKGLMDMNTLETVCDDVQHPMDLYYDGGDKLYIATVHGLYVIDITTNVCTAHFGNKRQTQGFRQNLMTCVYLDSRNNLWLGHTEGISVWDLMNDTIYYMDKESGLRDNVIQGIIEDNNQNIWITTSNGLSVLYPGQDSNGSLSFSFRNFTTKDGLSDNYFNTHAVYKLRNGDILLGGTQGYALINPNKMVEKSQASARVTFTGLMVGNNIINVDSIYNGRKLLKKPMEQTRSLTFRHNDQHISIHFTTGDLLYADKVKYAHKLDGFHNNWQTTPENRIVFSSLPPGNYTLHVKACNSDGIWSDHVSILSIVVLPPYYLSIWAFVLYFLIVIVAIGYSIKQIRKKQRLKLEQHRLQMEREQKANFDEMKLRFFTNISHDLRTPLTLIITPLQTILNGSLEDGVRKKLKTINTSAEHLLGLINSLLDFRKLDVGAETLRLKPGDITGLINELCDPFHTYAVDRRISFSIVDELEIKWMQFDHEKMRKIMINLLSNAFKFTADGGTINIRLYNVEENICIAVSDTGVGVSDADKPFVFQRFYQALQKQEHTGSGIGLHIAAEYVRMHGGTIAVQDNVAAGSIFIVKFPIVKDQDDEKQTTEDEESDDGFDLEDIHELPGRAVLLFVDDNKDLCEFMADSISDEYTVLLAYNGQEALEQLKNNDVNIVVSDVMMPVMNGIELCRQIKNNIHWSHIPVILLTARTTEENQLEGLTVGADDYISKPFNFNLLKLRVKKFMEWTEKCHRSFSQKLDVSPGEITITSLDEKLIEKAIKVVENQIADPDFSVEELSNEVGLSRGYLYKKLMSITGKGPAEFIRTIRLKRGRQLLEKSQMQIAEIAYAVGFNTPKRFTINFKSEFGVSPSEYLRSISKEEKKLNDPN